jgi:hypothetical protein
MSPPSNRVLLKEKNIPEGSEIVNPFPLAENTEATYSVLELYPCPVI